MYSQQVAMSYCNHLHFIAFVCICLRLQNMNYINRNRHSIRNISNSLWDCMVYNCKRNWIYIIVFGHFSNKFELLSPTVAFAQSVLYFSFYTMPTFCNFFSFWFMYAIRWVFIRSCNCSFVRNTISRLTLLV